MLVQVLINGTISFATIALVGTSFSLIYSTCRFFHLAHGAIYVVGAYLTYSLYRLAFPYIFALLGAMVFSAMIGMALERWIYRPLRLSQSSGLVHLLASLGLLIGIQSVFAMVFGNETRSLWFSPEVKPGLGILGARITQDQIWIMLGAGIFIIGLFALTGTALGQRLRAAADNPLLAESLGLDLDQIFLITFGIGSGLGGAAGGLISLQEVISPFMGFSAILYGILAAIIGGIGDLKGTILGSLILGMIVSLGVTFVSPAWKDTLALIVLMIILFVRPKGIRG